MKITDLQLSEYGIYRGASWQPSTSSLNVVMGENESGKTTMLRFGKRRSVGSRMQAMRNSLRSCRHSGGTVSHALCMSRSLLSA